MAVHLYSSGASLCLNGGELTINTVSLCERGYSQPPQVLPLPVWDDVSTQIIHVDKFMSSIMSMRRSNPYQQRIYMSFFFPQVFPQLFVMFSSSFFVAIFKNGHFCL